MSLRPTLLLALATLASACGARATRTERFDHLPTPLADLEATSEHAYDRALAGDNAAVVDDAARLLDDWTRMRGQAHERGGTSETLAELDDAVLSLGTVARSSSDPVVVARAANRVTASMDELYGLYGSDAGVMEIDYLGRELALDGLASDLRHAGTHLSILEDRWAALRPAVAPSPALEQLDAAVQATRAAVASGDAATITTQANAMVERVYDVEKSF